MTVLLTRPLADSQRIAQMLLAEGIESLIWPLTRIVFRDEWEAMIPPVEGLVFSSSNAVTAFFKVSEPPSLPVFCVGDRTAQLARDLGFLDVHSAAGDFDALVGMVCNSRAKSVLYLRGQNVTGDFPAALAPAGIKCESRVLYSAEPAGPPCTDVRDAFTAGLIRAVTIWSKRNATLFSESLKQESGWRIEDASLIGISKNAVSDLGNAGFRRIIVASRPNATQMVAEIRAAVR